MSKKTTFLFLSFFMVTVTTLAFGFYSIIKNSKDCTQFVIDSNEIHAGINIPTQTDCSCYYDTENQLRVGVYSLEDVSTFVKKYNFEKLDKQK